MSDFSPLVACDFLESQIWLFLLRLPCLKTVFWVLWVIRSFWNTSRARWCLPFLVPRSSAEQRTFTQVLSWGGLGRSSPKAQGELDLLNGCGFYGLGAWRPIMYSIGDSICVAPGSTPLKSRWESLQGYFTCWYFRFLLTHQHMNLFS